LLGGGTALALQLAHRKSYDFDVFNSKPISKRFLLKVRDHFERVQILVDTSDELSLVTPFGVKISFVFYPFHPLYKIIPTHGLSIHSWKDIALDKAYSIGRRGEWRDYVDLYFCMKNGFSLEGIIKGARKKFRDLFSEKLFLSQLCYFGDIKDYSIELMIRRHNPATTSVVFWKRDKKRDKGTKNKSPIIFFSSNLFSS
jgi:hypothetical protein